MRLIGAHIKKEGSVLKTLVNIQNAGGNVLQMFASNPRSVQNGNLEKYKEESREIIDYCTKHCMKIVLHAPYTINVAKEPKEGKRMLNLEDCYWVKLLINNLEISDIIGAIGVVFHVGKYTTNTKENGLNNMYESLKFIIAKMKEIGIRSKLIIETPAGAGTELLTSSREFIDFYNKYTDDEKKYLKICLDTAHIWSAGDDINEYYTQFKQLCENVVVVHFNNSKKDKGSHVDVHETIFDGKMKKETMETFIKKLKHHPVIVLEKPSENMKQEFLWIKNI